MNKCHDCGKLYDAGHEYCPFCMLEMEKASSWVNPAFAIQDNEDTDKEIDSPPTVHEHYISPSVEGY